MTTHAVEHGQPAAAPAPRSVRKAVPAAQRPGGHELLALAERRSPPLEIGAADDPLERAADRVATRVLRRCACGRPAGPDGECAECRARRLGLARAPAHPAAPGGAAPPIVHEVLGRPGAALDGTTRALFEPRLQADLAGVRVHRDAPAAASARAVDALAYTVGDQIVFGEGRYAPGTPDGRRLLAHELAHVLQQRTVAPRLQRQITPTCDGTPFDPDTELCCEGKIIPGLLAPQECVATVTTRDNEYDGCSAPRGVVFWTGAYSKDNPGGAPDMALSDPSIQGTQPQDFQPTLPCDVHDKCYQTCGADKDKCDEQLFNSSLEVCERSRYTGDALDRCARSVTDARNLLPLKSQPAFDQRQREYCACCPALEAQHAGTTVQFATGSATLDGEADKVVVDFVGRYRGTLLAGTSALTIVGHASRLGSEKRNDRLTQDRVAAVHARIEELLGGPIPGTVDPQPLGEKLADLEVPSDPADDSPEYRVVELILVGHP